MNDKIQKIREELARLKEETSIGLSEHENGVEQGRMEIIYALSIFLDSMREESVNDDLEEAIGEYCSNPDNFISYVDIGFAYRSEQKDDIPLIIKAIKFGANWQKGKILKDAIETTIMDDWIYGQDPDNSIRPAIHQRIDGCKVDEKVKVIVIKEN